MIRTKDCVETLSRAFPQYGKGWKRVSKRKVGDRFIRQFQHRQDESVYAIVTATADEIVKVDLDILGDRKAEGQAPAKGQTPGDLLERLRANPIKVKLLPVKVIPEDDSPEEKRWAKEAMADYSGRVIYAFDGADEDGSFSFSCGPETKEGALSDLEALDTYDKLKELFADFPTINLGGMKYSIVDIGTMENEHSVSVPLGVSAEDLWKVMEERLRRSGAVPMKER